MASRPPVAHPGKQKIWAVRPEIWPAVHEQIKAVGRA